MEMDTCKSGTALARRFAAFWFESSGRFVPRGLALYSLFTRQALIRNLPVAALIRSKHLNMQFPCPAPNPLPMGGRTVLDERVDGQQYTRDALFTLGAFPLELPTVSFCL